MNHYRFIIFIFSLLLLLNYGCVSTGALGSIPNAPEDFQTQKSELKKNFPYITMFMPDDTKKFEIKCVPISEVKSIWGEPDKIDIELWSNLSVGTLGAITGGEVLKYL